MKNIKYKVVTGLFIVISMITLNTNAQNVELGARFMPTFSSFKINSNEGGTLKGEFTAGYGFSGFIGINFTEHVGIQGEVMYNKLSQKYSEADNEGTINLEYINIPLLLSLNTGKSKPVNVNFVVGPQIGFNVGAEVKSTNQPDTYQATLVVKKNDLGLAYGAGVDFGLNSAKTFRLGIGYRGVIGLINISDDSRTSETEEYYILEKTNIKTYAIYAGISFLF